MELKDAVSVVGAVLGFGGLGFGLYQYYVAQKWKRAEFAAEQLEKLSSDPDLELCCKLLDWAVRISPVPERYASLTAEKTLVHDWSIMREAMLPEEDSAQTQWGWQHMMYRDVFDKFFDYLERINHYISIRLISEKDVSSLSYWLRQIACPRFLPSEESSLFVRFVERYGYDGVTQMMQRFRAEGPENGIVSPARPPAGTRPDSARSPSGA
jgi:hypothetical protein